MVGKVDKGGRVSFRKTLFFEVKSHFNFLISIKFIE